MRPDRLELRDDDGHPKAHRWPLPAERLSELAVTDPEEAGHLDVELASAFPWRDRTNPWCGRTRLPRPQS